MDGLGKPAARFLVIASDEFERIDAVAYLLGCGLDVPVTAQGLLEFLHADRLVFENVATHELRDVPDGREGHGILEISGEALGLEGTSPMAEGFAHLLDIAFAFGEVAELRALGLAASPQFLPYPLPGDRRLALAVELDEISPHQGEPWRDEASIDLEYCAGELGMHGKADGGLVAALVVVEAQDDVADGALAGAKTRIQFIAQCAVPNHAEAVLAQAAPVAFASAGIELDEPLIAAQQCGLDGIQDRGLAGGVGADEGGVALDVDLRRFQQVPVDQDDAAQTFHVSWSPASPPLLVGTTAGPRKWASSRSR